jgi:hypothetical protein
VEENPLLPRRQLEKDGGVGYIQQWKASVPIGSVLQRYVLSIFWPRESRMLRPAERRLTLFFRMPSLIFVLT